MSVSSYPEYIPLYIGTSQVSGSNPVPVVVTGTALDAIATITGNGIWGDTSTGNSLAITATGEAVFTSEERERDVWVEYLVNSVSATAYHVLIDLSDTTNWAHDQTGSIEISGIKYSIDRDSSFTGFLDRRNYPHRWDRLGYFVLYE